MTAVIPFPQCIASKTIKNYKINQKERHVAAKPSTFDKAI
jgi:hypothetical protein